MFSPRYVCLPSGELGISTEFSSPTTTYYYLLYIVLLYNGLLMSASSTGKRVAVREKIRVSFTCTHENLLRGLGRVVPIAGRNTQLPVLSNILVRLEDGVLGLTATDLEVGVETTVPGKAEGAVRLAVPARSLLEYVQQLPATHPIVLRVEKENTLVVTTEGFAARFPVGGEEEFPLLPTGGEGVVMDWPVQALVQALSRTVFAAAREVTRPELHSVFVQKKGNEWRVAAADGFRLAEEVVRNEEKSTEEVVWLLPLPTAQEIVRLFGDQETATVTSHATHIMITGDGVGLSSRLVEGEYPDYQQIIPDSFAVTGEVERDELVRALRTLSVFLPRDSRRVRLLVKPQAEVLGLEVAGSETGEGKVEVPFTGKGDDLEVLFNIQYLLDGVQSIGGGRTRLEFVGEAGPAVLRPAGGELQYVYVVMPIQA